MLYYIILYIILYYIILYYIILYYIILYYIILHYIILYYTILYYVIFNYIILYYIIFNYIILCYITLYYIILYLQAYSGYSDIIKHTMSKAKEINAIAFAKTLLLSLQQVRLLIIFCYELLLSAISNTSYICISPRRAFMS